MSKIYTSFKDGDIIFETVIKGITMAKLKKFASSTNCILDDFKFGESFYIPGVYLIAMFRHVAKKLHKENSNFPYAKLKSFYGQNGGTKENRVFIDEDLTYRFKYLSLSEDKEKTQFMVEISRSSKDIVLKGIFQFC